MGGGLIVPALLKTSFSGVSFDFCDPKTNDDSHLHCILVQTHGVITMCLGGCLGCPCPGRCCLTREAVWSVGGLVTSFSLS